MVAVAVLTGVLFGLAVRVLEHRVWN